MSRTTCSKLWLAVKVAVAAFRQVSIHSVMRCALLIVVTPFCVLDVANMTPSAAAVNDKLSPI
jgi:hypothetical protein